MSKNKNIDVIFRKKSLSFQKEPPPEIWDNILSGIQPEKNRVLPVFWRIAAGMAIVIALGLGYQYIFNTENLGDNQFSMNETVRQNIEDSSRSETTDPFKENELPEEMAENIGIENKSSAKDYSQKFLSASTKRNTAPVLASTDTHDELSIEAYNLKHLVSLDDFPIQLKPVDAKKDSIRIKEFIQQYTWEDLVAKEDFVENQKKDFLIEALLSPTYSYRDIVSSSPSLSSYYNDFESGQISYSGGMKVGFIATERLSIHTGLVYARIGYTIGGLKNIALKSENAYDALPNAVFNDPQPYVIANSIGKVNNADFSSSTISTIAQPENADATLSYLSSGALTSPENRSVVSDLSFSQIFHIMEIPFHMKYKIIDRKLDFNVLSGLSTNIMVGNNLFVNEGSDKTSIGEIESVNKINYSGDFGFGLEYEINKKLQLLFEPQFKYYLNSINKDNLVANRPYSMGFYTGLSYIF
ncbi:MAG: hypothetical protein K9H49_00790 [Bacteroidales bacterium]|nr:hypothetical protein [Bacteroidales bacterium]MCF8389453.1 hypothetical protein [Bacteroidales bacterium]